MFRNLPRDWRWYRPLVLAALATSAVMWGICQVPWPRTWEAWAVGGQNIQSPSQVFGSVLGPLSAIAAFIGIFFTWWSSNRTHLHSRASQLLASFQKGAEMLSSPTEATANAGIEVLRGIAGAEPALRSGALNTMEGYVSGTDRGLYDECEKYFQLNMPALAIPMSKATTLRAIQAISSVHFPTATEPFNINRPYLARWTVPENSTFGALNIANAHITFCTFNGCYFTWTNLTAAVGENVVFYRCKFGNASFSFSDLTTKKLIAPEDSFRVSIIEPQDTQNFTVNGMPIEEWMRRAPPPPERDVATGLIKVS